MGRIVNLFTWEMGVNVRAGIGGSPSGKNGESHQPSLEVFHDCSREAVVLKIYFQIAFSFLNVLLKNMF